MTSLSITISTRQAGIVASLGCSLLWGINHVLSKELVSHDIPPLAIVATRLLFAGLVILIVTPRLIRSDDHNCRKKIGGLGWLDVGIMASRGFAAILYVCSLEYITATATIASYKLSIVFTILFTAVLLPHRVPKIGGVRLLIGSCVIVIAVAGYLLHSTSTVIGRNDLIIGIGLAVVAAMFWALHAVFYDLRCERSGIVMNLYDRIRYTAWVLIAAGISISLIYGSTLLSFPIRFPTLEPRDVLIILLVGLSSGLAAVLYFESIRLIGAVLTSFVLATEVLTTALAEIFLAQTPLSWQVLTMASCTTLGVLFTISALSDAKKEA